MHRLTISLYDIDTQDETTVTITDGVMSWHDAHKAFFRLLRGAGYVINGQDYIDTITEDVTELVEAERGGSDGVALDVGGGGFLSGDDNV